jgi:microsomal dipeptidase-like Zn-dependent dipeptidase
MPGDDTKKEELFGWVDMHTHPMANLAFGGKLIHGAPDIGSLLPADNHCRKNVRAENMEHALCDDRSTHAGYGLFDNPCGDIIRQSVIDALQDGNNAYKTPDGAKGAPDFQDWPRQDDITHQKMWIDWIQRAYSGGLRVMVALAVNNQTLAAALSGPGDGPTDDKGSGDLQIEEIKSFVDRHSDFMKVAYSAKDLRKIVQANKLGVVLGIELDAFGNFHKGKTPSFAKVKKELIRLHAMGVRYIFPIHTIDNKLGGTAVYDSAFNTSNYREYGQFWSLNCSKPEDKITYEYTPSGFDIAVAVVKGIKLDVDIFRDPPAPPECDSGTGHMNMRSLTALGEKALKEMMKLGMMIDIDHMSQKSANRALYLAENFKKKKGGYPMNSGHNGPRSAAPNAPNENQRTNEQLQKIANLGGMLGLGVAETTPEKFISAYTAARKEMQGRSVGFGTDLNGLVKGPKPGLVTYDSEFNKCKTGNKEWDYNIDGVAHYGMLWDFLKAVKACPNSKGETVYDAIHRSANVFVQMWEKCDKIKSGSGSSGGSGGARCLKPRRGHGHEGEPCQCLLGSDGVCQYHG